MVRVGSGYISHRVVDRLQNNYK